MPSENLIRPMSLHPWSLTWNLKINPWKRRFLWEIIIFRFHVSFRGCTSISVASWFISFVVVLTLKTSSLFCWIEIFFVSPRNFSLFTELRVDRCFLRRKGECRCFLCFDGLYHALQHSFTWMWAWKNHFAHQFWGMDSFLCWNLEPDSKRFPGTSSKEFGQHGI